MDLYAVATIALVAFAIGGFAGHAAGYARAKAVHAPRYRRVGRPE